MRAEPATPENFTSYISPSTACSYPVRGGNALRHLIDGEYAFSRICEAVEAAGKSVWATVAYHQPGFEMPGGRGGVFDVLDRARSRGLDVRVIFWRSDSDSPHHDEQHFHGHGHERSWLKERGSQFLIRWDRAQKHYCQHQKSWLIDAGEPSEIAFVGGINLDIASVSPRGHVGRDGAHIHDVYLELQGPSASDVHHNFVQRWNEASERNRADGVWPDAAHACDLPFPRAIAKVAGSGTVQMQRTIRAGQYTNPTATPGGESFDIAKGEFSVLEQYVKAIDAARRTIYIEDQAIGSPEIVEHLHAALSRGVDVAFLVPADPHPGMKSAKLRPQSQEFFARLAALRHHDNFLLAGIAAPQSDGALRSVYVHAKIALVDDCWATIGSTNIATQSFFCDSELNAAIWDETFVRSLRSELLAEHLAIDTTSMEDRDALRHYRDTARANVHRRLRGEPMTGLAFAIDPATYGS